VIALDRDRCDVGRAEFDAGCPRLARYLILSGQPGFDAYAGGFWCCASHVDGQVDQLVTDMLRPGVRLAPDYRVAVYESVGLDHYLIAVIRPRRRGLQLVRA